MKRQKITILAVMLFWAFSITQNHFLNLYEDKSLDSELYNPKTAQNNEWCFPYFVSDPSNSFTYENVINDVSTHPSLAIGSDGSVHAVWEENKDGSCNKDGSFNPSSF